MIRPSLKQATAKLRAIRYRGCKRKVRHSTMEAAKFEAYRMRLETKQNIYAYACEFCDGFHCGHPRY